MTSRLLGAIALALLMSSSANADPKTERGTAGIFDPSLVGTTTSCGKFFEPYGLLISSESIPCFSAVKIVNIETGKSTLATVVEVDPADNNLTVQVSEGVATRIGITDTAKVLVLPLRFRGPAIN